MEETGSTAGVGRVSTAVECVDWGEDGRLDQHLTRLAGACEWLAGGPVGADDALEARWFTEEEWGGSDLALSLDVPEVIRQGRAQAMNSRA